MEPKDRLLQAIREKGYEKPTDAWRENRRALGISQSLMINNCNGNNEISKSAAKIYAKVFGHTAGWYLYGEVETAPLADEERVPGIIDVPRISWVTAGELGEQEGVLDFSDFPTVQAADLPAGQWIALRLEPDANSMNKISPPESVIFVNLADRRLVPNACYIITDERGRVTYKRFRPNQEPQFQPASYEKVKPPALEGAITVIGRVRRSMIEM